MFLQPVEQVLCFRVFQGVKASQAGVERGTRATGKGTLHSRVLHACLAFALARLKKSQN